MTEPNTKRKDKYGNYYYLPDDLISELRSKNPMTDKISKDFGDNYNQSFDNGYCKCVDELEKLLKEERK